MWTYVATGERVRDPDRALRLEYLLTNGLGGYAASTILGCNTRRYHGLLVAALRPPLDRWVLLSHFDELLVLPDGEHYLNTTEYRGGFHPDGHLRLAEFTLDPLPCWRWRVGGVEVTKRLVLVHGRNGAVVHYAARGHTVGAKLILSPFVAMRSFHDVAQQRGGIEAAPSERGNGFRVAMPEGESLFVHFTAGRAEAEPAWYNGVYHRAESERGMEDTEDLLRLGQVTIDLQPGGEVTAVASLGLLDGESEFDEAVRTEVGRRKELLRPAEPYDQREQALVVAADQFLVARPHAGESLVTILAGYPWFADWGRDTMIALPGLCLATGREDLARDVLRLWAGLVSDGMLPNRFEDDNRHLSYNAVDSALWFVQAAGALVRATGDEPFLRDVLWNAVVEILDRYHDGTRFGIRADADGLLLAGEPHTQLTWMDAKVGGRAVTPRHGKAVEIDALWVSALWLAAEWAARLGLEPPRATGRRQEARDAFEQAFWNPDRGCLYDCITDGRPDARIRPNQLLAVSLPHAPITGDKGRAVVDVCRRKLLTPVGLRTLEADDPSYCGTYAGNWGHRDTAYHQGTVWAWLLGPYVDALMATAEVASAARDEARRVINTALQSLDIGALGTVGEIFDGDAPHAPRGCLAQAWSVAELLRVKNAYEL